MTFDVVLATGAVLLALGVAATTALAADKPSLRFGAVTLEPYVLVQGDAGRVFGDNQPGAQQGGFNWRRFRLGGTAKVGEQVETTLIWDFGGTPNNHSNLHQASLAYVGLKPLTLIAGVFKPNFTLESPQDPGATLFLERATIVSILQDTAGGVGRVGGELQAAGERWFGSAALVGDTARHDYNADQRAVVGRVSGLPLKEAGRTIQLGASAGSLFRPPKKNKEDPQLDFSSGTELNLDASSKGLSTGALDLHSASFGGIEAAFAVERLWLSGEYYVIRADQRGDADDASFDGWYAQAAYTLVGRPRQFNAKSFTWGKPSGDGFDIMNGKIGAVELGGRYSTADLDGGGFDGGRQDVWSLGLSWYPTDLLRFIAQYQYATIDDVADPQNLHAFAFRAQVQF